MYLKQQAENDCDLDVEVRFLNENEIVPLGFSAESIILQMINANFNLTIQKNQNNESIVFFDHFTTKKNQDFAKYYKILIQLLIIQIILASNYLPILMKVLLINQKTFWSTRLFLQTFVFRPKMGMYAD